MNIDAPYEFTNFINSERVKLTPDPSFCVKDGDLCAIIYSPPSSCVSHLYKFYVSGVFMYAFIGLHCLAYPVCFILFSQSLPETGIMLNNIECVEVTYVFTGSQGEAVDVNRIHFAIKSCEKYHSERLPVLHNTWLKHTTNYAVYSDVEGTSKMKVFLFAWEYKNH